MIKCTPLLSSFCRWKYKDAEDLHDLREPELPERSLILKTTYLRTTLYSFSTCLSSSRLWDILKGRHNLIYFSITSTQHRVWHIVGINKYLIESGKPEAAWETWIGSLATPAENIFWTCRVLLKISMSTPAWYIGTPLTHPLLHFGTTFQEIQILSLAVMSGKV